jgi:hypothetical protein
MSQLQVNYPDGLMVSGTLGVLRPQLAAYQHMGNREAARHAEELGCVRTTTETLVWYRYRFQPAANK